MDGCWLTSSTRQSEDRQSSTFSGSYSARFRARCWSGGRARPTHRCRSVKDFLPVMRRRGCTSPACPNMRPTLTLVRASGTTSNMSNSRPAVRTATNCAGDPATPAAALSSHRPRRLPHPVRLRFGSCAEVRSGGSRLGLGMEGDQAFAPADGRRRCDGSNSSDQYLGQRRLNAPGCLGISISDVRARAMRQRQIGDGRHVRKRYRIALL